MDFGCATTPLSPDAAPRSRGCLRSFDVRVEPFSWSLPVEASIFRRYFDTHE